MRPLINKKFFFYLLILFLLASINNKNFLKLKFFKLNDFSVFGLSDQENFDIRSKFEFLKNKNIFLIRSNEVKQILDSNYLIETYQVLKVYPSRINVKIQKTEFLAYTKRDSKNFFIGSNKKLIQSDFVNSKLPFIFGKPTVENFFDIKKIIDQSSFNFSDIKNLYFFSSQRWDIEFKDGITIKLPEQDSLRTLDYCFEMINSEKFDDIKIFDLRVNGQIITNEL